jgi:hypothetical protein
MKTSFSRILSPLLLTVLAMAMSSCVSVEPRPQKTSHLEITVPGDWRSLYKVKEHDVTTDATNAAIEAAIIRHYAAMRLGPRVTDVIITRWWVKVEDPDRIVFEGHPTLVSSPHFAVDPLNLYLSGDSLTQFDELILTVRFEK